MCMHLYSEHGKWGVPPTLVSLWSPFLAGDHGHPALQYVFQCPVHVALPVAVLCRYRLRDIVSGGAGEY